MEWENEESKNILRIFLWFSYLDEEIKLKKAQKEVEDEKQKQKELYQEQKFKSEQDLLKKRYEDELRRELVIDYNSVAKNREKFEQVFLQRGNATKDKPQENKENEENEKVDTTKEVENKDPVKTSTNIPENIEEVFDTEAIFRRKRPAYSLETSKQEKPYFETSFASNDPEVSPKVRNIDNESDYNNDLQEIKRQQQRILMNQMELDKDYRPHVINGSPIQGYGLNRNKQASYDNLVQQYDSLNIVNTSSTNKVLSKGMNKPREIIIKELTKKTFSLSYRLRSKLWRIKLWEMWRVRCWWWGGTSWPTSKRWGLT